jgi:octaprenyl-diphosphate synthase
VEKTALPLAQLLEPVRVDLERVDEEFVRHIQSHVELIPRIGKYIQLSGGKRIRPAVLLMSARLCGYTGDKAVAYAAIVEFIHSATLVHDDIIDDAELRRGRRAVHSQWGNDVSVLVGDFLYIKAMALALVHDEMPVIRRLADVTLNMIEGELFQLTENGNPDLTEEQHFDIIRRKTAHLFGACAEIGGLLAAVPDVQAKALGAYGFNLGVTFQLVDDLLDLTGTPESLGKPVASDLREGKITLPIIHMLPRLAPEEREFVRRIVRDREMTNDEWEQIRGWLTRYGCAQSAYDRAVEFASEAKRQLEGFAPGPERDALMALPDYVISRDR